jgi:hypothetical protein
VFLLTSVNIIPVKEDSCTSSPFWLSNNNNNNNNNSLSQNMLFYVVRIISNCYAVDECVIFLYELSFQFYTGYMKPIVFNYAARI